MCRHGKLSIGRVAGYARLNIDSNIFIVDILVGVDRSSSVCMDCIKYRACD